MAAHADIRPSRVRIPWPYTRTRLDRRLADGAEPLSSPGLARRAAHLLTPRMRRKFAAGVERVVLEAEHATSPGGAAVPVQRDQVLDARRELLLCYGAGPVFAPHLSGALHAAARRAAAMVEAV